MSQKVVKWNVEQLRLTAFLTEQLDAKDIHGWTALFHDEPQTRTEHGRAGILEERGPFNNGQLIFRAEPSRCEWRLLPSEAWPLATSVPTIDPLADLIPTFNESMASWLALAPPLTRLAFGAVVLNEASDKVNAYISLQEYLSNYVKIDVESSSDFFYQINRRRSLLLHDQSLQINRLSRWNVPEIQRLNLPIATANAITKPSYILRLELDINTAPECLISGGGELWQDIWRELINLAMEIAEKGDVP